MSESGALHRRFRKGQRLPPHRLAQLGIGPESFQDLRAEQTIAVELPDQVLRLPAGHVLSIGIHQAQGSLPNALAERGVVDQALANLIGGRRSIEPEGQPTSGLVLLAEVGSQVPRVPDGQGMIDGEIAADGKEPPMASRRPSGWKATLTKVQGTPRLSISCALGSCRACGGPRVSPRNPSRRRRGAGRRD